MSYISGWFGAHWIICGVVCLVTLVCVIWKWKPLWGWIKTQKDPLAIVLSIIALVVSSIALCISFKMTRQVEPEFKITCSWKNSCLSIRVKQVQGFAHEQPPEITVTDLELLGEGPDSDPTTGRGIITVKSTMVPSIEMKEKCGETTLTQDQLSEFTPKQWTKDHTPMHFTIHYSFMVEKVKVPGYESEAVNRISEGRPK